MKKFFLLLFSCILGEVQAQTSLTVCAGSSATLNATNPQNWTSPSYTLFPGQLNSSTGSFVVSPQTSTTYTVILSGLNSSQQVQTQSTIYLVMVMPKPGFTSSQQLNGIQLSCNQPSVIISNNPSTHLYAWTNGSTSIAGSGITFTSGMTGTWTVKATDAAGCDSAVTFVVTQNFNVPTIAVGALNPVYQVMGCTGAASEVTISAQNATQQFTSPQLGIYSVNSTTTGYMPGSTGIYTYCAVDNNSGCKSCKTFTVVSSSNLPTFTLTSPSNFSIGCSTRSIVTLFYSNAQSTPTGANPLTFTLLPPGSPTLLPSSLGNSTTYTTSIPGTYTAVVKDMTNSCITRVPFSVMINTLSPVVSVGGPGMVTCALPQITLNVTGIKPGMISSWNAVGNPSVISGSSLLVISNAAAPNSSLAGIYTLTVQDTTNLCSTTQTILITQNLFKPIAAVSPANNLVLSCTSPSILMTNVSTTGIPSNGIFTTNMPVIGESWTGPSIPGGQVYMSSTYTVLTPGIYTLIAKDLNNGCTSQKIFTVIDNLKYAGVNISGTPPPANLCGNPTVMLVPVISSPTTGLTYTWTSPPGAVVSGVNSQNLVTDSPGIYVLQVQNTSSGCITQVTMTAVQCVGLSRYAGIKAMQVFPNPAPHSITVSGLPQDDYHYFLTDLSGRMIHSGSFTGTEGVVLTSGLINGTYMLQLVSSNGARETRKILKE